MLSRPIADVERPVVWWWIFWVMKEGSELRVAIADEGSWPEREVHVAGVPS